MKRVYQIAVIVAALITFFFIGFYARIKSPLPKNVYENISSLNEENQHEEIKSKLSEEVQFNASKSQCRTISNWIGNYTQKFVAKTCSSYTDCTRVTPATSGNGVCVQKSIKLDKLEDYNKLFRNLECANNFPEILDHGGNAMMFSCGCESGVCKPDY